jgi:putative GTP pyrophosphokinase
MNRGWRIMAQASKAQIDRLGDRLKRGAFEKADLILLDRYRRSFGSAYETVVQTIRDALGLEPSGRPAKSTNSLIEKLKRESIRLTQMQDIAGCRVVVPDILEQDRVVGSLLSGMFDDARVVDRREEPSYGYRAVHIIVEISGKTVEVQVRTIFQHIWAEISEKYADLYGSDIKYGGGVEEIHRVLATLSGYIATYENLEDTLGRLEESDEVREMLEKMRVLREDLARELDEEISRIDSEKGEKS